MKRRCWLLALAPAWGLAWVLMLVGATAQGQVSSEEKRVEKSTKSAERDATQPRTTERRPGVEPATQPGARGSKTARDERGTAGRERDDRNRDASAQGGGWLGVYLADSEDASGVKVSQVFPASPAARAGFRSGDVIIQVNDDKVTDPQSFVSVIEAMPPQTKANFMVQRNNQPVKLVATLGQNFWTSRGQGGGREQFDTGFQDGQDSGEDFPHYAMELEHNRRMAEQHERIERTLAELKEEVRQLREELKQKK